MVNRSVSVRIDGVLTKRERGAVSQVLTSFGGKVISSHPHPELGCTYAALELPPACDAAAVAGRLGAARWDEPALVVVEIVPAHRGRLEALSHALGGPGRPGGIIETRRAGGSLVVEFDAARTSLSLLVDLVDVELEAAPGRRIIPLIPLDDGVLAALARDRLGDSDIDVGRIIETYVEQMLAQSR